jgi:hypothetical protein
LRGNREKRGALAINQTTTKKKIVPTGRGHDDASNYMAEGHFFYVEKLCIFH